MTETPTSEKPKIRLLYCLDCKTIDELPTHDGPPDTDVLLQLTIEKHETPSGQRHVGKLYDVEVEMWSQVEVRKQIIDQIKGGSKGLAEMDAAFYDSRNTFHDDAMTCYNKHLRPKGACPDWLSDSKLLVPDTKEERKEAGLAAPAKAPGNKIHLCRFCPVQRYVAQKANEQRGIQ